jgi:PPK2 family polyphosphate:nucleotide phosphotransferase
MNLEKRFHVRPHEKVNLSKRDPGDTAGFGNEEKCEAALAKNVKDLFALQTLLAASAEYSVLIVLQAMDAGGKDGTIRHVMTGLNPQGCRVTSFKVPNDKEARHDFLWRIHEAAPMHGEVGIFNRSHYEDVLVVRVHKLVPKSVWQARYDQINEFEKMLVENNTVILKFFLHISKDEQKKRIEQRIQDPLKNWKLAEADFAERRHWGDYQEAYEDALSKCSTKHAPWYIIPANKKWFRNLAVSQIIEDRMRGLKMKYPAPKVDLTKVKIE